MASGHRLIAVALVSALVLLGAPSVLVAADAASAKRPRVTKLKHVGTVQGMPGARVEFTVVKRGRALRKVTNIRVTNVNLFCTDGNGNFSNQPVSTTFADTRIARSRFGWRDVPMKVEGAEQGYKTLGGNLSKDGKRASGDLRLRFWSGPEGGCGGQYEDWSSRAR
jgi:hypothetical protein